jgi:hypothetical protein
MPDISSLQITVATGEDDLRGDSSATAYVLVMQGDDLNEYSTVLKSETDASWENNTTHGPIVWDLPPGVTDENLKRFGVRLQSHPHGVETGDNWNINSVLVTYTDGSGGQAQLIDEAGGPLARLTGEQPSWDTAVNA